eukprot:jgi/Bigna1/125441/aug1.1_g149
MRRVDLLTAAHAERERPRLPVPSEKDTVGNFRLYDEPDPEDYEPFVPSESPIDYGHMEEMLPMEELPNVDHPTLQRPWDGWDDEDLEGLIEAQNMIGDVDRDRHRKYENLTAPAEEPLERSMVNGSQLFEGITVFTPEQRAQKLIEMNDDLETWERDFIDIKMDEQHGFIVKMTHPSGATAEVHAHGANIQSWIPANGTEMLWRDPNHDYARKLPIPGGIQLKFPLFDDSDPKMDAGGFASNMEWHIDGELSHDSAFIGDEPGHESLLGVRILNSAGDENTVYEFTGGLAAHFKVEEDQIDNTRVVGLSRQTYWDRLMPTATKSATRCKDRNRTVLFRSDEKMDRVYPYPPREIRLHRGTEGSGVSVKNARDFVQLGWKEYNLFKPENEKGYVVIESAAHNRPEQLIPGQQFFGRTHFEADVDWENPVLDCRYNQFRENKRV